MRTRNTAALLLLVASSALALPFGGKPFGKRAIPKQASKGKTPRFEAEGYKIELAEMEARAKIELAERGDREYTIRLKGKITAPKTDDAVAVTREPKVLKILDSQKRDILQTKPVAKFRGFGGGGRAKRLSIYRPNTYTPLHDGEAEIEIPQTKLRRDAYTTGTMELGATAIIAEQRESKKLRAIVMEEPVEIVEGVRLRVTTLKMTAKRELTVIAKCTRPKAGPVGPFVEQVVVLDENEAILAASRWRQGDPFGQTVTLTAELKFADDKVHKYLKFIACTKYSKKSMKFTVRDIIKK